MFRVFASRMITLKVLNSIVLLGTSCVFVKEANMEEKLFDPPPSAVSSRVNSRAHRAKHVYTAPQPGRNLFMYLSNPKQLNRAFDESPVLIRPHAVEISPNQLLDKSNLFYLLN